MESQQLANQISSKQLSNIDTLIQDCYKQKSKKLFTNNIWPGKVPENQKTHTTQPSKQTIDTDNKQTSQKALISKCGALPSCVYPQFAPSNIRSYPISNAHTYPYSSIGIVTFETMGINRFCTGILISNNLVLTSAICCYNFQASCPTENIKFLIGCWQCGIDNIQSCPVLKVHYFDEFENICQRIPSNNQQHPQDISQQNQARRYAQRFKYEIALLELDKPIAGKYGHFGISFSPQISRQNNSVEHIYENSVNPEIQNNQNKKLLIAGYTINEKGQPQLRQSILHLHQFTQNTMKYTSATHFGWIGAPIFTIDSQTAHCYVLGIHLGREKYSSVIQHPFYQKGQQPQENSCYLVGLPLTFQTKLRFNEWVERRLGVLDISYKPVNSTRLSTDNLFSQLQAIIKFNPPYLIGVSLNHRMIGSTGTLMLIENKWTRLTWLELANNELGTKGIKYLVRCDWPYLSRLSLLLNQIDVEALRLLCKSNWQYLCVLSLGDNRIGNEAFMKMSNAYWPRLSILTMSNNRIKDVDMLYLPTVSLNMKALSWLELHQNRIGIAKHLKVLLNQLQIYG